MNELEILIQHMLDGKLTSTEHRRLSDLLKEDPEARLYYTQQCQLHAELVMNEGLGASLSAEPPIDEEYPIHAEYSNKFNWLPFVSMVAASVVISVTVIIAYQSFWSGDASLLPEQSEDVVSTATPQEVYEQTEFSEPGSQKRPPTNFVNVTAEHGKTPVSFNRDIRPILSENCYACHGPDAESREADLRFDLEAWAFKEREEGPPAIIRGNPEDSLVYQRITNPLKSEIMPPPDSNKVLTDEQKELVRRWIEEGAKWEGHWAFIKPKIPDIPKVSWGNNTIDKFTFAAMQNQGLKPNKEADRPTLARRLALDLTGLPPTPEVVENFIHDTSSNAYENLVDKLLADSAYGEHQARIWLDAARYSDTHGLHLDNYREIWPYRDWVIRAFNENKPFNEFTVEQIAGDLLPSPSVEQRVATGFNRCNPTTSEGGAIDDEYRAIYAKDRVETTSTVFLGLTMGCASCHDHKFDPFSRKDFYQLSAFFNNLNGPVMDGNAKDTKPIIIMPRDEHKAAWKKISPTYEALSKQMSEVKEQNKENFNEWLASENPLFPDDLISPDYEWVLQKEKEQDEEEENTEEDEHLESTLAKAHEVELPEAYHQRIGSDPFTLAFKIKIPRDVISEEQPLLSKFDGDRGIRLTLLPGDYSLPDRYLLKLELIHSLKKNDLISITTQSTRYANPRPNQSPTIVISYDGSGHADGVLLGASRRQLVNGSRLTDNLSGSFATDAPLIIGDSNSVISALRLALYDQAEPLHIFDHLGSAKNLRKKFPLADEDRHKRDTNALKNYYFDMLDPEYSKLKREFALVEPKYAFIYDQATTSLVMEEKDGLASAFMLERGEYDKPTDEVYPQIPEAFGTLPPDAPKNRLSLAKWLVNEDNPLTARVTVNRFWQNFFGTGLVATSEDFGVMGENPSHPELLDWLAVIFLESGWDVKALLKMMVSSETYRQDSRIDPKEYAIDSENRYLARGPRYRLDGEVLRDQALWVSGLLKPDIGGPSVRPYQPSGIWNAVAYSGSNTRFYHKDEGDALYRRSLYTFWKRTAPPPNMVVFDAPSRENCSVRRDRTNTPLQALTLMNDPQYVEAARHLAQRAIVEYENPNRQIAAMYKFAFGIAPSEKHLKILSESYSKFHSIYDGNPKSAEELVSVGDSKPKPDLNRPELASLTMVASQIMNLDSFVNKF